jgi:hypothetical protein|tara:strand:- start:51 stop:1127 length:1077 start_codon:yes stop_codon:yes gene_type:complete
MPRLSAFLRLAAIACFCLLSASIPAADAFAIPIAFNQSECFSKYIEKSRDLDGADGRSMAFRVMGSYVVSKDQKYYAGAAEDYKLSKMIEVKVRQPDGKIIHRNERGSPRGEFDVEGKGVGTYSICFTNSGNKGRKAWSLALPHQRAAQEDVAHVRVHYFQPVHADDASAIAELESKTMDGAREKKPEKPHGDKSLGKREGLLTHDHAKEVRALALNLQDEISLMRQELFYLKSRATRHKKTADSNSRRTLYWTLAEVGVLCAVAAAQIVAVRYFFSKDAASKGRMHGPGSMGVGGGVGGVNAGTYQSAFGGGGFGGGGFGGAPPPPGAAAGYSYGVGSSSVYGDQSGLGNRNNRGYR